MKASLRVSSPESFTCFSGDSSFSTPLALSSERELGSQGNKETRIEPHREQTETAANFRRTRRKNLTP